MISRQFLDGNTYLFKKTHGKCISIKAGVSLFNRAGAMLMVTTKHCLASMFTMTKDTLFRVSQFR